MSDDEIPVEPDEGIQYVDEQGHPESLDAHLEGKVVELPALMTASELLADDPLSSLPVEPADDETPPDPTPLTDAKYGPRGTPKRDAWDALQRERAKAAHAEIMANPAISTAMKQESVRLAQKAAIQEAFIKAQKAKAKS